MKCREFDGLVVDLARGRGLEEAAVRDAKVHAESCARCAARLAAELDVTSALGALAESMRGRGAPERVETALTAAFARSREQRRRRRTAWLAWAAAAAAAVFAIAGWLREPRRVEAPAVVAMRPAPVPAQAWAQPPQQAKVVPRRAARRPAVRAVSVRSRSKEEVATRFYPLRYPGNEPEAGRGPVVRVQVPRTVLVSFGLPIDQDRALEPVEADVLLDRETGMAREIRFVRKQ
jgi:hypothetical protein